MVSTRDARSSFEAFLVTSAPFPAPRSRERDLLRRFRVTRRFRSIRTYVARTISSLPLRVPPLLHRRRTFLIPTWRARRLLTSFRACTVRLTFLDPFPLSRCYAPWSRFTDRFLARFSSNRLFLSTSSSSSSFVVCRTSTRIGLFPIVPKRSVVFHFQASRTFNCIPSRSDSTARVIVG